MNKINALGFVEVSGFVAAIEAADAMLKSANVRLLREHTVNPGMISIVVEGDLAACRAAVSAGIAAAERVGRVISHHVIGRPDEGTEDIVLGSVASLPGVEKKPRAKTAAGNVPQKAHAAPTKSEPVNMLPQQPLTQEAEKHPEAAPEKLETPSVKPAESVSLVAANVIDFIAASGSKGRSLNEIKKRFPELAQNLRAALNAEVAAGRLSMAGARYRNPT